MTCPPAHQVSGVSPLIGTSGVIPVSVFNVAAHFLDVGHYLYFLTPPTQPYLVLKFHPVVTKNFVDL